MDYMREVTLNEKDSLQDMLKIPTCQVNGISQIKYRKAKISLPYNASDSPAALSWSVRTIGA